MVSRLAFRMLPDEAPCRADGRKESGSRVFVRTEITIEYEGQAPWKARELVIGPRAGKRPKLPASLQPEPAASSRLLRGAKESHMARKARTAPAVSYRAVHKEGEGDV